MIFLPIVARELRVAARRQATFWIRTGVALGAIGTGVFLYMAYIDAPGQSLSQRIFATLVVLAAFFCLFAGRHATADCLSEEKRQGTLGLLFLTDLKGYDIVLGKLAATSLNGFYSLLAVFPVLAVPILMGGITNGEFWRAVLVLANTFLFSLSVGIFVSALSHDARRAMGANLLLLLLIIAVPGACGTLLAYFLPSQQFKQQLLFSCPLYSLYLCSDTLYRFHRAYFWLSVGIIHVLTWVLLALASWAVRYSWQDKPAGSRRLTWRERWRAWNFGPAATRALYRKRLLDANAFYWLAARSRFKPLHVWGVLLFVAGWWIWARIQFGTPWTDESTTTGANIATAVMLNVALKLWVGLEACRQLAEERQSGSFELLLSTPLTIADILQGQWLALRRQFLVPALLSTAIALIFMINSVLHSPGQSGFMVAAWLGAIFMFLADVAALAWTAMYSAMITHSPNQASVVSISRIVLAPAIVFGAIAVLMNLYAYVSGVPGPRAGFYLAWWLALGFAVDLIYGLSSRKRLLTHFRDLACHGKPKSHS
jgi:ABC-type Na+ efflux pump permease subunit